jgi:nitrite reductase (NADH) small subunit
VEGREIGVLRTAAGTWYAARNLCPHRGAAICEGQVSGTMLPSPPGELRYGLDDTIVRCPWHLLEFSLETGECVFGTYPKKLPLYRVACRDGTVLVSASWPSRRVEASQSDGSASTPETTPT